MAAAKSPFFANDGRNVYTSAKSSSFSSVSTLDATSKTYRLDGVGRTGGTGVDVVTNTGHTLSTDIPFSMGGSDEAPQPVETLLAAWMGCTQATASFVGRQLLLERFGKNPDPKRRRPPRREVLLDFHAIEAVRDEKGSLELPIRQTPSISSRLQRITGKITVSVVTASGVRQNNGGATEANSTTIKPETISFNPEELEVLKDQTEARCPIANMLKESGCAMDVEWVLNEN